MSAAKSGEDEIKALTARVEALEKVVAALRGVFVPKSGGVEPADDDELDGKYGDPAIRRDPPEKYWRGDRYVGCHLSECPADYLEAWAKYKLACAFVADKDPAKAKYANYDRKDAARALGWARRIKAGQHTPKARPASDFGASEGSDFGGDTGFDPGRAASSGGFASDAGFGDPGGFDDGGGDIPF